MFSRISVRLSSSSWGHQQKGLDHHSMLHVVQVLGQGLPYLLAVLCLLHLALMIGDLNQPDGILMIHVGAQESHLLAGLLDLRVQPIHLVLKA